MILSLARDLYFLARETVGAIGEGIALGLKIVRDESPGVDQITHGPAWFDDFRAPTDDHCPTATCGSCPAPVTCEALRACLEIHYPEPSPVDGAVTDPVACERPAAAASATDAAAGHPMDDDLKRLLISTAYGLQQWIDGETCGAPTYFGWLIRDLEDLSK